MSYYGYSNFGGVQDVVQERVGYGPSGYLNIAVNITNKYVYFVIDMESTSKK